MSALGQKRTHAAQQRMSALPPIATAKADIAALFDHLVGAGEDCGRQVRPSTLAVLRLRTNSSFVGCSTGGAATHTMLAPYDGVGIEVHISNIRATARRA